MTEAEIMKALECCCNRSITKCIKECPLKDFDGECYSAMKRDILDLINRKNAKIDELQIKTEHLAGFVDVAYKEIEKKAIIARAEAIKEFAERVKDNFEDGRLFGKDAVCRRLDQIAKEMGVEL